VTSIGVNFPYLISKFLVLIEDYSVSKFYVIVYTDMLEIDINFSHKLQFSWSNYYSLFSQH
jgi:hypothetical protein